MPQLIGVAAGAFSAPSFLQAERLPVPVKGLPGL
jgi:hypothetical protein